MKIVKKFVYKPLQFIVRFFYCMTGVFFFWMETAANWLIGFYGKTEYIKKGKCVQCGKCCNLLAIQYPDFFNRFPRLIKTTIKWHKFRYSFSYFNKEGNYLLYRCDLLTESNKCGRYWTRPRLCREYPKRRLYGRTHTHYTCGYYFIRRDGKPTFDEALHKANSPKKA